jgi:hypothetical protein
MQKKSPAGTVYRQGFLYRVQILEFTRNGVPARSHPVHILPVALQPEVAAMQNIAVVGVDFSSGFKSRIT